MTPGRADRRSRVLWERLSMEKEGELVWSGAVVTVSDPYGTFTFERAECNNVRVILAEVCGYVTIVGRV